MENQMMTAEKAIEKLRNYTKTTTDEELAKKLNCPATAIRIFQSKTYSKMRAYRSLVHGAQVNLGLDESFFYEEGDPEWTPAKPAEKVEVVENKAVAVTPVAEEVPAAETEPAPVAEQKTEAVETEAEPFDDAPVPAAEEKKPAPEKKEKAEAPKPATAPKVANDEIAKFAEQVIAMTKAGMQRKEILQTLKIGKTTFYKYLKLAGVDISKVTADTPSKAAEPVTEEAPVMEAPVEAEAPVEETPAEEPVTETTEAVAETEAEAPEAPVEDEAEEAEAEIEAEPVKEEEPEAPATPEVAAEPEKAEKTIGNTVADSIGKAVTSLIENAVAEASKKCESRAEKLAKLVEKAAALSDEKLDAIISLL